MPDTTSSTTDSTPEDESGGGKGRLIITALLCMGLAGAGFVLGGRLSGGGGAEAASDEAAAEAEAEEAEHKVGGIVELEAVNVNLAEGHYLRIAVAVGLSEHYVHAHSGGGHGGDEEIPFESAPASDLVLGTFSGRHMEELATQHGREGARMDLLHGLENYYGEDVVTIYLTEFVMQ